VTVGVDGLGNGYQRADWRYFAVDSQQPYAEVVGEWEGSWQRPVNASGVPTGPWVLATGASSGLGNTGWVPTVAYHLGLDRLTRVGQASTHWYLFDGLGSTRALTNGSGVRTDGFDYSAFGIPSVLAGSSGVSNSFLFNAQQWDGWLSQFMPEVEGLYFLRARYYQPGIGRFTRQDRLTFEEIRVNGTLTQRSSKESVVIKP
jgi:RHS repeat-associated protein